MIEFKMNDDGRSAGHGFWCGVQGDGDLEVIINEC